jgi:aryl-alcohol dehydrogenase-like predicted oxidoreductase
MRANTVFEGDDLRQFDPKFRSPRFEKYLAAVRQLDEFAGRRFGKRVIQLAVRWMLDQRITSALWGARHPEQLRPTDQVSGWTVDDAAKREIERIVALNIDDPIGPDFMAPPTASLAA